MNDLIRPSSNDQLWVCKSHIHSSHYGAIHLLVLTSLVWGLWLWPRGVLTVAQESASQTLVASNGKPDAKAAKLIDRVQALVVAPAPADAKTFSINGMVCTPDYKPARAMVACWLVEEGEGVASLLGRAFTDIRGHYSMEIAATVKPESVVQLIAVGFNHRLGWTRCDTTELVTKRSHAIVLHEPTGAIEGVLLTPGNIPLAGVEISLRAFVEFSNGNPGGLVADFAPFQPVATSDENGHFVFDGLPSRIHAILKVQSKDWISKDALVPTSFDAPAIERSGELLITLANPANVQLYPKRELTGIIVDSQGHPIAGARLSSTYGGTTTDEEGKYALVRPDLDAWGKGESTLYVERFVAHPPAASHFIENSFSVDSMQFAARIINPCVLNGEWLSGRILSTTRQKPLAGILVQIKGENRRTTTGVDGRFQMATEIGQQEVQLIPQWMTRDEQSQFLGDPKSNALSRVAVVDGQQANLGDILLDLDPQSAKPLVVKVVMADGAVASGCRVGFAKSSVPKRPKLFAGLVEHESFVDAVKTDEHGIAVVKPASGWGKYVPDGKQVFPQEIIDKFTANLVIANTDVVSEDGTWVPWSGWVEFSDVRNDVVEIKLVENVRITGRVLLNGRPLIGVEISGDNRLAKVSTRQTVHTDFRGIYEFLVEPVHAFRVLMLRDFPIKNISFGLGGRNVQATDDPQRFVVPDIEFVSGNGEIRGIVVDENGQPVVGAHVGCINTTTQIWIAMISNTTSSSGDMPSLRTVTDAGGKFVFSGLPDGVHPIVATDHNNELWKEKVRISAAVQIATGDQEAKIVLPSIPKG